MACVDTYYCLQFLNHHQIVLILLVFCLESTANTKTLENESLYLEDNIKDFAVEKDLLYVKNDDTVHNQLEFSNHGVGFELFVCLRLYKFRTEVKFMDDFEEVSSIGERLIGPLYRAAYNGDLGCVSTLVKEFQSSNLLKGNFFCVNYCK